MSELQARPVSDAPQMCTVDDITSEPPCQRIAQWRWQPEGEHPVFLCNFHADPLLQGGALIAVAKGGGAP